MPQTLNPEGRIEHFSPTHWESSPSLQHLIQTHLDANEIHAALTLAFELPPTDTFAYWAHMPVTLPEMQHIVSLGDVSGLHHWYSPSASSPNTPNTPRATTTTTTPGQSEYEKPSPRDISAYLSLFSPRTSPSSALNALESEAKAHSIRRRVGTYLRSKRYLHPSLPKIARRKQEQQQPHWNPGLVFWAWYCRACAWGGPVPLGELRSVNHPALPVMMHHFGCVVPSWEALEVMRVVVSGGSSSNSSSNSKTIHEIGSGNGYWTYMLRRHGLNVRAVDSGQSVFRTNWIGDTIEMDAVQYLAQNGGASDGVLLMVYPVVSGDFTRRALGAFRGDVVVVAGTQNGNGYTGFKDVTMDEWMRRERPAWTKMAQIALPSFPGKDEAMFVFSRVVPESSPNEQHGALAASGEVQPQGRNAKANARKRAKKKAKAESQAEAAVSEVEAEA